MSANATLLEGSRGRSGTPQSIGALLLPRGRHRFSDFAGNAYTIVALRPNDEHCYYCWDTLTTVFVGRPEIFGVTKRRIEMVVDGPSQGRTRPVDKGGREVDLLTTVDRDAFYDHFVRILAV